MYINNRDEAVWRLQKVTPIISVLDKPTEPFVMTKTSSLIFGITGFFAGCFLSTLFLVGGLIFAYTKSEIHKSLFGNEAKLPLES